ncbi:tetratricopeptide repeat protein [Blastopirellula sp. JC732]|uniref:Tetratricopeptide repeat protein n=1 Tax=Blastopirellula sediminis TaxID=2894196 RepID=A0A9X1MR56_9BACT|nr:tetratricopeptide repeat protein [Blastopirellula sediminis]MCC9605768.1 tetratricopeptide repeat protein [Blastopirellula sediminis]MCC9630932.1 tetratricopeptide repeat protein [Blastopirellula sediminis]
MKLSVHDHARRLLVLSLVGLTLLPTPLFACLDEAPVQQEPLELAFLPDRRMPAELPKLDRAELRRARLRGDVIDLTNLMEKEGKTAPRFAKRAEMYAELGQTADAVNDYDAAIELEPKSLAYLDRRVELNYDLGKYEEVEADLTKLIELDATAKRYLDRGNFYHDRWKFDPAIEDYSAAIKLDPNLGEAYAKRAHMRIQRVGGKYRNAPGSVEDLEKGLELDPDQIQPRRDLVLIYISQFKLEDAVKQATAILDKLPDDPCARHYRSKAYRLQKKFDLALEDANKLLQKKPDASKFLVERAKIYEEMGEKEKALADYEKSIGADSKNFATYAQYARHLLNNKKYESAVAAYKKAISLNAFSQGVQSELYAEMANANYWLGELDESERNFAKASELDPTNLFVRYQLADVMFQRKKYDEMIEVFTDALESHPQMPDTYLRRAQIYALQGNFEAGLADADTFISKFKSSSKGYAIRAKILRKKGDAEAAKADEEKVAQLKVKEDAKRLEQKKIEAELRKKYNIPE